MKHKYDGLCLDRENPDEQPDSDKREFFKRIATGGRFRFLFTINRHDYYYPDKNHPLFAQVLSVKNTPDGLIMEIDTSGQIVPPGIKHGRYKLKFTDDTLVCDDLPDEMFEE